MAAYAALLSLKRIIEKLHLHPHPPPISLHQKQVESLTAKISFLEEFLEAYNPLLGYSTEADPLETRIADAAYAAEDVIESNIVDRITNENMSSDGLYEGLEKVIQDMASIQKEAMGLQLHHHTKSTLHEPMRSTSIADNSSSMVGVDDVLLQIKDELTSNYRRLQIVPIVGMGGSGKTTLASNIYQDRLIKEHFHVYAWATISQEYSIPGIFSQILGKQVGQHLSEGDLGNTLHKYLFGRKYLIIMDDIWNIEAWENVRKFFPDNENGSRVVITTRLSNLASEITSSNRLETSLLDENNSWNLLAKTIFGENGCPLELEEIGKKIAKSCKGLPLSIVVVGGFLAKSKHTREFWEYIEKNLNSIVNSVEDESCLKILHMSYKQLPLYLKPCFLYMGVFGEDEAIRVSRLSRLWVAEGFLKQIKGKSLEEIAKEYLRDLTDRNLILIWKKGISGSIKECKIHDLLREFCLREAEKERFYVVARQYGPHQGVTITQRRIVISKTSKREDIDVLQSVSLARSLIWGREEDPPSLNLRLLRIFESRRSAKVENMCQLVNLRFIGKMDREDVKSLFTLDRLWNLETLYFVGNYCFPVKIWCMPHIRHAVQEYGCPSEPPTGFQNGIVLENLHTLDGTSNFQCSEETVKRIPNVKKLRTTYGSVNGWSCPDNLVHLQKLVSLDLDCSFWKKISDYGKSLNFPQSLKKLKLSLNSFNCWQDTLKMIGSLSLLEKLILYNGYFEEGKWETAEAQFLSLKHLKLDDCNLKQLIMESSHFPRLERLVLTHLKELEEIPLEVAEIPTLESIELWYCSDSAALSTRRIVEEQDAINGEASIQVRVQYVSQYTDLKLLSWHRNIQVEGFRYYDRPGHERYFRQDKGKHCSCRTCQKSLIGSNYPFQYSNNGGGGKGMACTRVCTLRGPVCTRRGTNCSSCLF